MISVIIPTYNEEENIVACIDSLLKQTVPPNEIIIADCSTDNTAAVAEYMLAEIDHTILPLQRRGIGYAREQARKIAKYNIILSLDADSVLSSHFIERLLIHFQNSRIAMVVGRGIAKEMTAWGLLSTLVNTFVVSGKGHCMAFRNVLGLRYRFEGVGEDFQIWKDTLRKTAEGWLVLYDPSLAVDARLPTQVEQNLIFRLFESAIYPFVF